LLKETTGTFDRARTHNLHITSQTPTAPRHPMYIFSLVSLKVLPNFYKCLCTKCCKSQKLCSISYKKNLH